MKKVFIIIFFFLASQASLFSYFHGFRQHQESIRGDFRSCKVIYTEYYHGDSTFRDRIVLERYNLDSLGKEIDTNKTKLMFEFYYERIPDKYKTGNGKVKIDYVTFIYNDKSQLIEQNSEFWRNTFKYNDEGKIIENTLFDSKGEFQHKEVYTYDSSGLLKELILVDSISIKRDYSIKNSFPFDCKKYKIYPEPDFLTPTERDYRITYLYNSKGQIILEKYYDICDSVTSRVIYKYNENDLLIYYKRQSDSAGYDDYWTFNYDRFNKLKGEVFYDRGITEYYIDYYYDNYGNVIEVIQSDFEHVPKEKWEYYY